MTVNPSRKFEVIGDSIISPDGFAINPRNAPKLSESAICYREHRSPSSNRAGSCALSLISLISLKSSSDKNVGHFCPDADRLRFTLPFCDDPFFVLLFDYCNTFMRIF